MFNLKVDVDIKKLERELNDLARSQIPFATAKTLTQLAQEGQKATRQEFKDKLEIRKSGQLKGGVRIKPAKKQDYPYAYSVVGIRNKFDYLSDHVESKNRKARSKHGKAIPLSDLPRTKTGKVSKANRPAKLLKKKRVFEMVTKGGNRLIAKRTSKQRYSLLYFYRFRKKVHINDQVKMHQAVDIQVRKNFNKLFGMNLAKAIASSKKRRGSK